MPFNADPLRLAILTVQEPAAWALTTIVTAKNVVLVPPCIHGKIRLLAVMNELVSVRVDIAPDAVDSDSVVISPVCALSVSAAPVPVAVPD